MITIAERLRPFSHLPGSSCLIPTTPYLVEAFPQLVKIKSFEGELVKEIELEIEGPLKQFTLLQDLERGCVTLFSELYHFHILPNLDVTLKKHPPLPPLQVQERLSLGSHKKQEWEMIKKRRDFREIFPLWFRLGSLLKLPSRRGNDCGIFSLLKNAKEACREHRPEKILSHFEKLFLAGFSQLFVPRAFDADYQGILSFNAQENPDSPLHLLTESSSLIRSLFIMQEENEISILPNLPPEFFAGKMVNISLFPFGTLDFEWSKKSIRKVHFHALIDSEIIFHFPPNMRFCRLRSTYRKKGDLFSCGDVLEIKSNSHYLLDQFKK